MKWVLAVIATLALAFFFVVPKVVETHLNRVLQRPPYKGSSPPAVDLHADPLLWGRDLDERSTRGHVDVPRLRQANVRVQVFGVVTKTPRGMNLERNDASSDQITLLAVASRWPVRTWSSLLQRALYQAERLKTFRGLQLIRTREDLRKLPAEKIGALLALEGSQALEGELANVDKLYDAGFRMMAPAHFFDTEVGGSAHGVAKGGLSALGRQWVAKLEERKILIDLAHASPKTFDDVLALAHRPVVVSHTGVKATCDNARNLSDAQLRKVAANGGLVGIGYWQAAVCGTGAAAIARAMRHAADVMGVAHVALGSDFDGAVAEPFDVTGLPLLAQALRDAGFSEAEVKAIFSENAMRLLAQTLP